MAVTPPIIWHAPQQIAAGDPLVFQLNLPAYPPSAGWSVVLTVTLPAATGGKLIAQITSTPDSTNTYHCFDAQNFLEGAAQGTYVFSEELVCSPTGVSPNQRSQIYFNEAFYVGPDLQDGNATGQLTTHAQRMIPLLQSQLERLAAFDISKSNVQRTEFFIVERDKVLKEYLWYLEKRNNEIKIQKQVNSGFDQVAIRTANTGGW